EQPPHQVTVGPGDDDLRSPGRPEDFEQIDLQALGRPVVLRADLLLDRQHRLGLAEINDDLLGLDALDNPAYDVSFFAGKLGKDHLALGLSQALHDHLLGSLRRDTPRRSWQGSLDTERIADL